MSDPMSASQLVAEIEIRWASLAPDDYPELIRIARCQATIEQDGDQSGELFRRIRRIEQGAYGR